VRNEIVEREDVIGTGQFDEPGARNVLGDIPPFLDGLHLVVGSMDDEGRDVDRRQDVSYVGIAHGAVASRGVAGAR
jgi:hypothetical protein